MRRLKSVSVQGFGIFTGLFLAASGLSPRPGGISVAEAQTAPVVAHNITIHTPAADYTIPTMELAGTPLSAADLTAILDAQSTVPLKDRLARLTAATITIPEVSGNLGRDDKKLLFAYHDIKLTNVAGGKIATLTVGGATAQENAAPRMNDVFGAFNVAGLDLVQAAHVLTETRQDAGEALAPIVASFTIDSITIHVDGIADVALGKLSLRDLAARAYAPPPSPAAPAPAPGDNASSRAAAAPNSAKTVADTIAEALGDVSLGGFEISGIKVAASDRNGFTVKLGDIALARLARGTLGQIAVQGFEFGKPGGHVKVDSLALGNINLNAPLATIDAVVAANNDATMRDLGPRVVLPEVGDIALSKVDVDIPEGRDNGPRIQFQLGSFKASLANYLDRLPTSVKASLDHLALPIPQKSDMKPLLAMGYTNLDVSAAVDAAWDEPSQQIRVNGLSANGVGFGGVHIAGSIGNVSRDLFANDPNKVRAAFLRAAVNKLDLTLTNDGIVDRALKAGAGNLHIPPDEMAHFVAMGSALAVAAGQFAAQPNSIHVGLNAPDGIGAADFFRMSDPRTLLGKINIVADANQAAPSSVAEAVSPTQQPSVAPGPTPNNLPPTPAPVGPPLLNGPPGIPELHYFYASNNLPVGPLILGDLAGKIAAGALNPATLVWKEGTAGWVAAKDLPELANLFGAPLDLKSYFVGTWEIEGPAPTGAQGRAKLTASFRADGSLSGTYSMTLANFSTPVTFPVTGSWTVQPVAARRAALSISMVAAGGDPSKSVTERAIVDIIDSTTVRDVEDGTVSKRIAPL